jgi:hypothetical protein
MEIAPVTLAVGQNMLLEPAIHWEVQFSDAQPPSIVLTASITPPISPTQAHRATTVALQMDAQVAMQLYEKLGDLGRSMGWLPQKEGEHQA